MDTEKGASARGQQGPVEADLQAVTEYEDLVRGPDLGTGKPAQNLLSKSSPKFLILSQIGQWARSRMGCRGGIHKGTILLALPWPEERVKPQPFYPPLATSVLSPPAQVGG